MYRVERAQHPPCVGIHLANKRGLFVIQRLRVVGVVVEQKLHDVQLAHRQG